jgi:hypothetical protein
MGVWFPSRRLPEGRGEGVRCSGIDRRLRTSTHRHRTQWTEAPWNLIESLENTSHFRMEHVQFSKVVSEVTMMGKYSPPSKYRPFQETPIYIHKQPVWVSFYVEFRTSCCDITTTTLLLCRKLLWVSSCLTVELDSYIPYFTKIQDSRLVADSFWRKNLKTRLFKRREICRVLSPVIKSRVVRWNVGWFSIYYTVLYLRR